MHYCLLKLIQHDSFCPWRQRRWCWPSSCAFVGTMIMLAFLFIAKAFWYNFIISASGTMTKKTLLGEDSYFCVFSSLVSSLWSRYKLGLWILPKNDSFNLRLNIAFPKIQFKILKKGLFIKNGKYWFKIWFIHSFHDKIQFKTRHNVFVYLPAFLQASRFIWY